MEENIEHLDMIRKALDLIDDRVFSILKNQGFPEEVVKGFLSEYRQAHENLTEMVNTLAGMAGIDPEIDL